MNKSFGLLFYSKRTKTNANGLAPIYLRVTIDGEHVEISSKRYINPNRWNTNRQKLKGTSEDVKTVNAYLKTLEHEVYDVHRIMIEKKLRLTVVNLKNMLLGKTETSSYRMLCPSLKRITTG